MDYDTWKTSPPEPTVVGECRYCYAELYSGCEYVHDRNEEEWFCDDECLVSKLRNNGEIVTEVKSHDS